MPAHNQPYFLDLAAEDLVHHSAAWVIKSEGHQPSFIDCHAVIDNGLERGWDLQVTEWSRDELGGWGESQPIGPHGELDDAHDASRIADSLALERNAAAAKIPYNVFEEVVDEHDKNYLIALAISLEALPPEVTGDEASKRIFENADTDISERSGAVIRDNPDHYESLDEICDAYDRGGCGEISDRSDEPER